MLLVNTERLCCDHLRFSVEEQQSTIDHAHCSMAHHLSAFFFSSLFLIFFRVIMLKPIVEAPSIINKTTRAHGGGKPNYSTVATQHDKVRRPDPLSVVGSLRPIGQEVVLGGTPLATAAEPTTPTTWESDGPDPATARPIQRRRLHPWEHGPAAARAESSKFPAANNCNHRN